MAGIVLLTFLMETARLTSPSGIECFAKGSSAYYTFGIEYMIYDNGHIFDQWSTTLSHTCKVFQCEVAAISADTSGML